MGNIIRKICHRNYLMIGYLIFLIVVTRYPLTNVNVQDQPSQKQEALESLVPTISLNKYPHPIGTTPSIEKLDQKNPLGPFTSIIPSPSITPSYEGGESDTTATNTSTPTSTPTSTLPWNNHGGKRTPYHFQIATVTPTQTIEPSPLFDYLLTFYLLIEVR